MDRAISMSLSYQQMVRPRRGRMFIGFTFSINMRPGMGRTNTRTSLTKRH